MERWHALGRALDVIAPAPWWAPAFAATLRPWRVVVVGRVGVGKTGLIEAMAARPVGPRGLGGATHEVVEVVDGDRVLVDTPGLDDLDELGAIEDALARADALIWVVDGLMPAGAAERAAVARLVAGRPVDVVVSRLDLVDAVEVPAVLARVARVAAPLAPRLIVRVDLRAPLRAAVVGVGAPVTDVRRIERARLLEAASAWLRDQPPLVDEATELLLEAEWRRLVRGAWLADDPRGFYAGAWPLWTAWNAWIETIPEVAAAGPPATPGPSAGRRDAAASRWALEGALALQAWSERARRPDALGARRQAWRALAACWGALDPVSSSS